MAFIHAPQFGVPYTLVGPDGTRAVFNDDTDPDFVGALTNISGLDSADVRDSGDIITQFDGGVNGPNYFGRRPIVVEGVSYGHGDALERSQRLDKIIRASQAMRGDAVLQWTPTGGEPLELGTLRRSQPLRVTGGWNKT